MPKTRSLPFCLVLAFALLVAPLASAAGSDEVRVHEDIEAIGDEPEPVIVVHDREADPHRVDSVLAAHGFEPATLHNVGISHVMADRTDVQRLTTLDGVQSLYPNEEIQYELNEAAPLVNAPKAWNEHDTRGSDATVLVIDTGIDATHPDLQDRVIENAQPANPAHEDVPTGDYVEGVPGNDQFGHGTHVAGIVAGTGQGLGEQDPSHGEYVGMAPETNIVGWSLGAYPLSFQVAQGFDYAIEKQDELGIDVVTNSWSIGTTPDPEHPISVATLETYKAGISVVFAAGNDGPPDEERTYDFRINPLAVLPWTVAVAATDSEANIASFSSQGSPPETNETYWDHPTIAAQGESVMAAKSNHGVMQALGPQYGPEDPGDVDAVGSATHYQYASGTSMSTPGVAGVIALMYDGNPELSPPQVYDILVETAQPMDYAYWEAGIGLADAHAAVEMAKATEGMREAFVQADEVPYTDFEDPLDDPARSYLVENLDEREDAKALVDVLDVEDLPAETRDELGLLAQGENGSEPSAQASSPSLVLALLAGLFAAIGTRGRR